MKREIIRSELESLKRDGKVRPVDVVEAARDEDSPLHGYFTWDDSEAANQYRLEEARRLLRVFVVTELREVGDTRAYVSLTTDRRAEGGGYRILADVMDSEELSAQMLADAMADLARVQQKHRAIKRLAKVWESIDEARTEFSQEQQIAA